MAGKAPAPVPGLGSDGASSCTPTTLYSTTLIATTTNIISHSSTQTPIATHSTKQELRTVCAAPPGLEMRGCQIPFVQTDNVDVFGSLTWVSVDVTRIETVTETRVEGVKTVPCGRGLDEPSDTNVAVQAASTSTGVSASLTASATPVAASAVQTSTQAPMPQAAASTSQVLPVQSEVASSSSQMAVASTSAPDSVAGQEQGQATITSTRYHQPEASNSRTPASAASSAPAKEASTGEIVGIVFGVLVGLLIFGVAVAGLLHWWRGRGKDEVVSIDDEEILAWRRNAKESGRESWQEEALGRKESRATKHQSTTPSFISAVSRLANLARKPYGSPFLRAAPTYGGTARRSRRGSRSTLGGQTLRSPNRLSQADLGSLVQTHSDQYGSEIPLPPLPPKLPPMPFKARPPSSSMTISTFGGDIEALDENESRTRRLTPWNLGGHPSTSSNGQIWLERQIAREADEAYGGVGGT